MVMEHRYHKRLSVSLTTDVYHLRRKLGRFSARNISREGLFLQTGQIGLYLNESLDLSLKGGGPKRTLHGLVARVSDEGVGLVLEQGSEREFYDGLIDLMLRGGTQPAHRARAH